MASLAFGVGPYQWTGQAFMLASEQQGPSNDMNSLALNFYSDFSEFFQNALAHDSLRYLFRDSDVDIGTSFQTTAPGSPCTV